MTRSRYNSVKIGDAPAFPACAHPVVEQQIARGQWGFRGLLVSDCGAIFDEGPGNGANTGHGWCAGGANATDVMQHCVAASLKAGTHLDCPGPAYFDYASDALQSGYLAKKDVDAAFERVVLTMIRLGLLDDDEHQPHGHLGATDVDTPAARELALVTSQFASRNAYDSDLL
eukprot:COSAG01_NODE_15190_length_1363_cov_1.573576_3_plen_172_part_00